jgi:hypothetical protein
MSVGTRGIGRGRGLLSLKANRLGVAIVAGAVMATGSGATSASASASGSATWNGNGLITVEDETTFETLACSSDEDPFVEFVLAGTSATTATISVKGRPLGPMTKVSTGKNQSVWKYTYTRSLPIDPEDLRRAGVVASHNGKKPGILTAGAGCSISTKNPQDVCDERGTWEDVAIADPETFAFPNILWICSTTDVGGWAGPDRDALFAVCDGQFVLSEPSAYSWVLCYTPPTAQDVCEERGIWEQVDNANPETFPYPDIIWICSRYSGWAEADLDALSAVCDAQFVTGGTGLPYDYSWAVCYGTRNTG